MFHWRHKSKDIQIRLAGCQPLPKWLVSRLNHGLSPASKKEGVEVINTPGAQGRLDKSDTHDQGDNNNANSK